MLEPAETTSKNRPMPVGFVGHGAPTLGLENNAITQAWRRWAQSLPIPKAVLVLSAHWLSPQPQVGPLTPQPLLYDFYGFPGELYRVQYTPPATVEGIDKTLELLRSAGFKPSPAPQRGLDHGAWVPLMKMYPEADIPAFQISLPTRVPLSEHLALGKALAPLRNEGVFILGSGNVTHNLRQVNFADREAEPEAWAADFDAWVENGLNDFDLEKLTRYREAPGGVLSHPTDDHYTPLVAAAAAAGTRGTPGIRYPYEGFDYGTLSMRCVEFT
jgi:4,5-DOPA dioxygenase extradiol